MGSINYSTAIRPDTAYIKRIIETSLLADWAIRVEYECHDTDGTDWRIWGKTCFAITSAKPILELLHACYTKHPRSTIRISAEKFRPQSRMLFTVYNPQYLPAVTQTEQHKDIKNPAWEQDQFPTALTLPI